MKFDFQPLEKRVLDDLAAHGRVYLVGGIVRDMLLFQSVDYHDVDVEIYDIEKDDLEKLLSKYGHVNTVGKAFGIYKLDTLPHFDFALPRLEKKKGPSHKDFDVLVDQHLDLKTACLRRDFTVNALMYDYQTGEVIDFFGGLEDLNRHVLKMVNEDTFQEDPLRVLRLAQFISRLEFGVDSQTKKVCIDMVQKGMLEHLSKERIFEEYSKLLMAPIPSLGIVFLSEIGALFEPLLVLKKCNQRLDFHPEGNVMNHVLLVVDLASLCKNKTSWPLAFMWGCLLHDIGKPAVTTPEGRAPGHHESGVRVFREYFSDFFKNKKMKKYVETMIYYHMHLMNVMRSQNKDYSYYKLLKGIDGIMPLDDLVYISKCDKLGRLANRPETIEQLDEFVGEKVSRLGNQALKPIITGQTLLDMGFQEGKEFKELLDWTYDLQMRGHNYESLVQLLKGRKDGR